jgi:hypothetical protein
MKFLINGDVIFQILDTIRFFDQRGDAYAITGKVVELSGFFIHLEAIGEGMEDRISISHTKLRDGILAGTTTLQVIQQATADDRVLAGFYNVEDMPLIGQTTLIAAAMGVAQSSNLPTGDSAILTELLSRYVDTLG